MIGRIYAFYPPFSQGWPIDNTPSISRPTSVPPSLQGVFLFRCSLLPAAVGGRGGGESMVGGIFISFSAHPQALRPPAFGEQPQQHEFSSSYRQRSTAFTDALSFAESECDNEHHDGIRIGPCVSPARREEGLGGAAELASRSVQPRSKRQLCHDGTSKCFRTELRP